MQSDYLPELGEEFAAISSGVCGISPLMAKDLMHIYLYQTTPYDLSKVR